jgi:hypothetical protein
MNLGPHVVLASVIVSSVLMGCASPRSFLGASLPNIKYEDVKKRATPLRLQLVVEFQRNGTPFPQGDVPLRDYAAKILAGTGVISPIDVVSAVEDQGDGAIRIVMDNIADSGTVAAEASRSRFPLWMVGKTITDAYTLSIAITMKGKTIRRTGIKHAFHTAFGNMEIPQGVEVFPSNQAFGRMLEQMILRALQDMQLSGELSSLGAPREIVFLEQFSGNEIVGLSDANRSSDAPGPAGLLAHI